MQEVSLGKIIISRPNFNITYSSLKTCLESIDFFNRMLSGLSPFALKNMLGTVAKKLEFREVEAEKVVYGKGDTNKDIYFVITGEVGAFIIVDNVLNEIRNFTELEGFGDAEAVADIHRLFATIAKKPSILALLKPEDFREVLKDYHQKVYQAKFIKFMHNFILGRFTKSQLELIVHNSREVHAIRNQIIY
jgi:CRP-like cAMP-binding protein